jgi:hypothetical protein
MRVTWKLALLVAIGIAAQVAIERYAAELDEAWFATRVFCAHACSGTAADPELMELATALEKRQNARRHETALAGARHQPTTRRVDQRRRDVISAEELEWSRAIDDSAEKRHAEPSVRVKSAEQRPNKQPGGGS